MDIKELRQQIDQIDDKLVQIFNERMNVAAQIAEVKRENDLPVLNTRREREILAEVAQKSQEDIANYTRVLYSLIFELSRSHQQKLISKDSELHQRITARPVLDTSSSSGDTGSKHRSSTPAISRIWAATFTPYSSRI